MELKLKRLIILNIYFLNALTLIMEGIDRKELSEFGVDMRYPGDMFVPDKDETLEYKNLALEIKDFVENKIDKILKLK